MVPSHCDLNPSSVSNPKPCAFVYFGPVHLERFHWQFPTSQGFSTIRSVRSDQGTLQNIIIRYELLLKLKFVLLKCTN